MLTRLAMDGGLIAGASLVLWRACHRLELASHNLAQHYGLPEIVKGSLVMAVSSSFPELATVVLAGSLHGDYDLGLASVIGSAIFNILVIPGILVFFSPATSMPDLFLSVRAARRAVSVSSLSNALGSNIFDLLVGLPAGVIAAGTVTINYPRVLPMTAFLILATAVMLVLARRDFALSNRDGVALLSLYAVFIGWITAESFGLPTPS